jgi:hypothetical protein
LCFAVVRRLLFVSPHFPPVNAPDHQRVRALLPHLSEIGWNAEVLCVDAAQVEAARDELLERTLPASLPVHRCNAISLRLARTLRCGQLGYRAHFHLRAAGDRLLRTGRFDLVFFSTALFETLALGPRWKARHGVPFVVDLHDPWVTDYYGQPGAAAPPGGRLKFALAQAIARRCEPRVMRAASHVVCVSPDYPKALRARYPDLPEERFSVVPFAAPQHDFAALAKLPVSTPIWPARSARPRWLYLGRVVPAMKLPLSGFFRWLGGAGDAAAAPEPWFVGTKYLETDRNRSLVAALAEAERVNERVREHEPRVPYFEGLKLLQCADAVLVIGSDDPSYNPSKVYSVLLAGRPVLALIHRQSAAAERLRGCSNAVMIPFDSEDTPDDIARRLEHELGGAAQPRLPAQLEVRQEQLAPFTDRGMTSTLVNLMNRLVHAG